jgi:hypothetical protein
VKVDTTKKLIRNIGFHLDKIFSGFDQWYKPGYITDSLLIAILNKPNSSSFKESNSSVVNKPDSNTVVAYEAGDSIFRFFDNVYKHANEREYSKHRTKVIYLYYYFIILLL